MSFKISSSLKSFKIILLQGGHQFATTCQCDEINKNDKKFGHPELTSCCCFASSSYQNF